MPLQILAHSSFPDSLSPSLILNLVFGLDSFVTVLGLRWCLNLKSAARLTCFTGEHWSWNAALALGFGQVIWIVTEVLMLRGLSLLRFFFGGSFGWPWCSVCEVGFT
ncbi:hypothetical protein FNU79_18220 [Deinococcus detaillensis]|uniref:Uncharacterized protein n=1 Tax=Deinococcus detaillensis TaxID=2592048 RepID=A0A553UG34_9DEIO|nr:hypothetical protein [Deinococcus detaillensis]TSA79189.1 hypothetical protein FNU79_18220 [Deinococcus detaillensis]